MTDKVELQNALNDLWQRYGDMLQELNTSLNTIDKLNKDVKRLKNTKPTIVTREVEVEKIIEKIVEVEVPVEIEKETIRVVEKEVPGPERIVEVEVPGPERIVHVPGKERVVVRTDNSKIEQLEQQLAVKPSVVEKANANNLIEAARIMSESEFNKEGYTEEEILNMLTKTSEEEVNRQLGFWAIPLPSDEKDKPDPDNLRYTTK